VFTGRDSIIELVGEIMIPSKELFTNLKDKISETKYFLRMMRENESDVSIFRYNLAAFLCAGHGVRDYIKKTDEGEWINQHPIESDEIGLYFWKLRVISVHTRSVNPPKTSVTTRSWSFFPKGFLQAGLLQGMEPSDLPLIKVPRYFFEPMDEEVRTKIKNELEKKRIHPDDTLNRIDQILRNKDVLTLCNEYIQMLSKVVEDFEACQTTLQRDQ
jgi:hypothetical protein